MNRLQNMKRRILGFAITALCVAGLTVSALAAPVQPSSVTSSRVHDRASAGSSVIGQLEHGTEVSVLGQAGDFYRISCYEVNGYIAKEQLLKKGQNYYVNCEAESEETESFSCVPMADALRLRSSILETSRHQLKKPYIYAGSGPYGFDCSGLTTYVYRKNGYTLKRSADVQMQDGMIVPRDSLQVGDLLFFRQPGSPWLADHVGIYAGNNQMIHSASGGVQYTDLDMPYYANSYVGARRVICVSTEGVAVAPSAVSALAPAARTGAAIRTAG